MTTLEKWGEALLQMLFPRRCPVCGELLTKADSAHLCPACVPLVSADLAVRCPVCRRTAPHCLCTPVLLKHSMSAVGGRPFVSVGFYRPAVQDCACNRLIYTVKDSTDDTAARVLARMLSREILRLFLKNGEDIRQWIITYPPRTQARKSKNGVDQAQRLARFCAKDTGASYASLFVRRGGREQKSLSAAARIENTKESLMLKHPDRCRGKCVILCDDILTSGATLARCAELLRDAGAEKVFAAPVLKTISPKVKKTHLSDMSWFQT